MLKAVILVGGPQKGIFSGSVYWSINLQRVVEFILGTRFRPLSLNLPKPLFPVAGYPIIQHHIEACAKLNDLKEILIIGYYATNEMQHFIGFMQIQYTISIRLE